MARRTHRHQRTALRLTAAALAVLVVWDRAPVLLVLAAAAAAGVLVWRRQHRDRRPGWVYHLPGWDGRLVYVGMTTRPDLRMGQHQGRGAQPPAWFAPWVDWSRVGWYGPFDGEAATHRAEIDHIHTYEPWANRLRYEDQRRPRPLRRLGQPAPLAA